MLQKLKGMTERNMVYVYHTTQIIALIYVSLLFFAFQDIELYEILISPTTLFYMAVITVIFKRVELNYLKDKKDKKDKVPLDISI